MNIRLVSARSTATAAAVLGGLLVASHALAQPQTPAPPQDKTAQQQAIPDAPRPQPLPQLNTITPAAPAVPEAPQATTPTASTPATAAPDGIIIPEPGQGAKVEAELEAATPPPPPGQSSVRVQVNFVEVPFTVKDSKNQLVPGLTPRDVDVFENNLRQQIRLFTVDPFPLTVALVIDQSVTQDIMETVNNALRALGGAFTPYDEVSVFTYNNGVKRQSVATGAQSPRLAAIVERSKGVGRESTAPLGGPMSRGNYINGHDVDPNTTGHPNRISSMETPEKEFHTLNDAILAAANETSKAVKGRRRVVYVISDGKEYGSTAKQKDVIKYCQTNKVSVWATLVGDSSIKGLGFLDRIHLPLMMRDDVLPTYAAATGGQVDPEFRQKGIEASFAKITEQVRTQYTVGYYSHEPILDGKFRKVEVRVKRPSLTVIAKDGYYPSVQDGRPNAPVASPPVATP